MLGRFLLSATGTCGVGAVEIVIETMKTEITEVHSEAGQQFKAKNVSYFEDVLFGGAKRLQEVGFKDRGIRAVF